MPTEKHQTIAAIILIIIVLGFVWLFGFKDNTVTIPYTVGTDESSGDIHPF